jgi:hypothetical protein
LDLKSSDGFSLFVKIADKGNHSIYLQEHLLTTESTLL